MTALFRPRILFVGAFPPAGHPVFGGMVTSCRTLLGSSLPARSELVLLDSTQISNPPPGLLIRGMLALRRVWQFRKMMRQRPPGAVLLFAAVGASVAEKGLMAAYARSRGIPALMFPRGGAVIDACRRSAFTRWWVRRAFGSARMVLCQGPAWREFARDSLGFAPDSLPLIANWTATPELLAIGASRAMRGDRTIRLVFVGWLDREKGIAELLDACLALTGGRTFEMVFIGEGNMSREARAFVQTHELGERIAFRGWLNEQQLRVEYAAADVFVLPSWAEGLPNALIEAMAAGLACVVTSVGNVPDAVEHERSALLVAARDTAALTRALERVIDDAGLRARLGAAAHAAAGRYGVERAVDEILSAVAMVMATARN